MAQCVVCSSEIRDDARFCPSCGAEQPRMEVAGTDADPLMGKVVARKFKVEKLLGVGGMGKVYKARQLSLDKAVVVKVLHDQFREDPQLVQRFQREAKAASRLNHPNSIQIIDFGQDDGGVVFMAMEFLQGQDLFAVLKRDGPLPPGRIAKIMIQACSALAEAHEQHVVHRDLKPENIMVEDRRGQKDFVKVLDFGIAKIQDPGEGQQALTQAGMVCGTPEYMSPEQARGLQLDPRSDIYALGVVMYQLAVGELPFVADTPIGIVTKHILEKPVPPRQRAPQLNIPEELENIIMKAMEKEADKRFSNATELAEALEALAVNYPYDAKDGSGAHPRVSTGTSGTNTAATNKQGGTAVVSTGTSTTTKPTPTGQALDGHDGGGGGSGLKIAAASFVGVVLLAVAALVVFKLFLNKPDQPQTADAGVAAVVADAGAVVADAGNAIVPPPAIVDAGSDEPEDVDAGVVAIVDAGSAKRVDAGVVRPPRGNHLAAKKIFGPAHQQFIQGDCGKAMPELIKAARLDPTFGEPMRDIAMCHKLAGHADGACSAIKEFVKRKHMRGANAENYLKQFCQ